MLPGRLDDSSTTDGRKLATNPHLILSVNNHNTKMVKNEIGSLVAIYGIASPYLGCNCKHHSICGTVVHLDMLVRFQTVLVTTGKSDFNNLVLQHEQLTHHFRFAEHNEYKSVLGVFWVTEGVSRCIVGHVPITFATHYQCMEG